MTAPTRAQFNARHPEFASVTSDAFDVALEDALPEVDEDVWGDLYKKAVCLLVAHNLAHSYPALVPAALTSVTVGKVSKTYASPVTSSQTDAWDTTTYGTEFKRLRRTLPDARLLTI